MMYTDRKGTSKRSGKPVVAPSNADLVCVPRGPALMAGSACRGPFETHLTVKMPP